LYQPKEGNGPIVICGPDGHKSETQPGSTPHMKGLKRGDIMLQISVPTESHQVAGKKLAEVVEIIEKAQVRPVTIRFARKGGEAYALPEPTVDNFASAVANMDISSMGAKLHAAQAEAHEQDLANFEAQYNTQQERLHEIEEKKAAKEEKKRKAAAAQPAGKEVSAAAPACEGRASEDWIGCVYVGTRSPSSGAASSPKKATPVKKPLEIKSVGKAAAPAESKAPAAAAKTSASPSTGSPAPRPSAGSPAARPSTGSPAPRPRSPAARPSTGVPVPSRVSPARPGSQPGVDRGSKADLAAFKEAQDNKRLASAAARKAKADAAIEDLNRLKRSPSPPQRSPSRGGSKGSPSRDDLISMGKKAEARKKAGQEAASPEAAPVPAAAAKPAAAKKTEAKLKAEAMILFDKIDKNSDSTLTKTELKKFLQGNPELKAAFLRDGGWQSLFGELDTDQDSSFSKAEFEAVYVQRMA